MLNIRIAEPAHPFQANTYLISSDGECAVIDPSVPFDKGLLDGKLKYILLTHAHFDHMLDIDSWVNSTDAAVIVSDDELGALSDPMRNCYKLFDGSERGYFGEATAVRDGDQLRLGDLDIQVIRCPGHTIGSVTYLVDGCAFVGDTVFSGGGYGRCDLPTGNMRMLYSSIERLTSLDDGVVFYPGHGDSTTVKQYKQDIGR